MFLILMFLLNKLKEIFEDIINFCYFIILDLLDNGLIEFLVGFF